MPLVSYSCSASAPGSLALKVLSKIQDTSVDFTEAAESTPSLKIITTNPIVGTSSTSTSVSWLGCSRTLSQIVPSLGLWDGPTVESWVESATTLVVPALEAGEASGKASVEDFLSKMETHLSASKEKFITGTFTAADVCLSIWLAQAMLKCDISNAGDATSAWMKGTLTALKSCDESGITPLLSAGGPGGVSESSPTGELNDNPLVKKLQEFGLEFDVYPHALCMTAEELVLNVPLASDKETHTKNLFFKDKKHGLFLVTHATASSFNANKDLKTLLNLDGKVNMRLADEDTLEKHLAVKKGCVGPLCIVNDSDKEVTLVLDKKLTDGTYDFVHSHPLRNDASVKLKPAAFLEYLSKIGIEPAIVDFGTSSAPEAGGKAPATRPPESKDKAESKDNKKQQQQKKGNQNKKSSEKGKTLLKLQWKKSENFPQWYSDVIVLSEMISYYDISGCYILRPWSYKIWDLIQQWFNKEILKLGVENCYFPLFVSQDRLEKEKDHVEGFAPEVAWVTKSGESELAQPIAIRPTSETIMYPAYSDWIKSHRDLPLKLNQWSNVVRWEFKFPTPFLRSREFLWQEGHTAHATYEDADEMVMQALDLYKQVYQDLLCVPVIPGYKTQKEKFAGGHQTTTVEAYIPGSGRAIQGATSHNLGQNFGKMFDIKFQDANGESQIAWQTSWGLTTRTIGVMVMVHGDDIGLVMPPRIAPQQVVIVPVTSKGFSMEEATPYCLKMLADLEAQGLRAKFDDRSMQSAGWKYNHWEQKGVPIRLEVGPADVEKNQTRMAIRYNKEKVDVSIDGLGLLIEDKLEEIQKAMFEKAVAERDQHVAKITEWKDFVPNLEKNNLILTPWCGGEHEDWEDWVKKTSKEEALANLGQEGEDERTATSVAAKTLCIPFDQPELPEGTKCIASGLPATCWVLWGRSY